MDIQTYLNYSYFFLAVYAWFAFSQFYVARMIMQLPEAVAWLEVHLVPTLLDQKQTIAHNLLRTSVLPVWKAWLGDLMPFSRTNNLFVGITLLGTAFMTIGIVSIWIGAAIGFITLCSMYSTYVVRTRQKLMQNGFDLVYKSTASLAWEQTDGNTLTPDQQENRTATLNTLNDEVYWKQMIRFKQPE